MTTRWLHHNNYRLFTIPLSLGYEKKLNNWFLSIEAQTILNFRSTFSGRQLGQDNLVTDGADTIDQSFKLGIGVSVGVRYAFTNTTSVYLRPHYFRYTDSFVIASEDYDQKYGVFGLQVGLSYQLF